MLAAVLVGCQASPVASEGWTTVAQAQKEVPFRIRVPESSDLPAGVERSPRALVHHYTTSKSRDPQMIPSEYFEVDLSYDFQKPNARSQASVGPAVFLIEAKYSKGRSIQIITGTPTVLDGTNAMVTRGTMQNSVTWSSGGVNYSLSTELTWPETLRIYRSILGASGPVGSQNQEVQGGQLGQE